MRGVIKERQRQGIREQPFPAEWRKILRRRMPYFYLMPADLQLQLKQHIQVFLAEKDFVGCDGIVIDDDIRVTIAAQACLLILNRKTNYYPALKSIYVYPSAFVARHQHTSAGGVVHEQRRVLSGESWSIGKVIVSWQHTVSGAQEPEDGQNVVIHEFAHQLDHETGDTNGVPLLNKDMSYQQWSDVFNREFELLKREINSGIDTLFDAYGATNPAEFFAVATEVFFEQSQAMLNRHPQVYGLLSKYFKVDPVSWC
nr:M90 family metallopeptidase [Pleionea sp. CnH1-48]